MAIKSRAIIKFLLLSILLAMAGHALGTRAGLTIQKKEGKKKPEWFIEPDGSVIIPGIGRILVPMPGGGSFGGSPTPLPSTDGSGGDSLSPEPSYGGYGDGSGSTHIPGGGDTLAPNPGYEAPVPSSAP